MKEDSDVFKVAKYIFQHNVLLENKYCTAKQLSEFARLGLSRAQINSILHDTTYRKYFQEIEEYKPRWQLSPLGLDLMQKWWDELP